MQSARLSRVERRDQLLDAAAAVLTERGQPGLTMEGLAAAAGVSKALPYAHFDNAEAVQVALYQREVADLGRHVLEAMEPHPRGRERLSAAVRAYFDFIRKRGAVMAVLSSERAVVESGDADLGPDFVGQLLVDNFDIAPEDARVQGALVLGALLTVTGLWARRVRPRAVLERQVIDFIIRAVER